MYPKTYENPRISIFGYAAVLLIGGGVAYAQHQYPTSEIPTDESAYMVKAKTGGPEPIVNKATIVMMKDGKTRNCRPAATALLARSSRTGRHCVPIRMQWSG